MQISIDSIKPDPGQPRKRFTPEQIDELAGSIGEHGLLQPIVVRPATFSGNWVIVAGERRYRACQKLGLKEVDVVMRDVNEADSFQLSVAENTARMDLNPIEEAEAFSKMSAAGLPIADIAVAVGRSEGYVKKRLSLLHLAEPLQELVRHNQMNPGTAEQLARLDIDGQYIAFRAVQGGARDTDLRLVVDKMLAPQSEMFASADIELTPTQRDRHDEILAALGVAASALGQVTDRDGALIADAIRFDGSTVLATLGAIRREATRLETHVRAAVLAKGGTT